MQSLHHYSPGRTLQRNTISCLNSDSSNVVSKFNEFIRQNVLLGGWKVSLKYSDLKSLLTQVYVTYKTSNKSLNKYVFLPPRIN